MKWIALKKARRLQVLTFAVLFVMHGGARASTATAPVTFRTIALNTQQAPGTASGVTIWGFDLPKISDNAVAFSASLTGPGITDANKTTIYSTSPGALSLVARMGSQAPGYDPGVNFGSLPVWTLGPGGSVVLSAAVSGPSLPAADSYALWSTASGPIAPVIRSNTHPPGTPTGVVYSQFSRMAVDRTGTASFIGIVSGPGVNIGNDYAVWCTDGTTTQLLAREGDAAPGTDAGVVFGHFVTTSPLASLGRNRIGQTVMNGMLLGPGITSSNNSGLWIGTPGSLSLAARAGSAAPGVGPGVNFGSFGVTDSDIVAGLNDTGQIAFKGRLTGNGVTSSNNFGVWAGLSDSLSLVARTGTQAPGMSPGVNFLSFQSSPAKPVLIDSLGHVAFRATTNALFTTDHGIWTNRSGSLQLLAGKGSLAPGGGIFSYISEPVMNGSGQIAFFGTTNVPGAVDGIWATDRDGVLKLIARESTLFELAPGDVRLVTGVNMLTGTSSLDGRDTSINDRGELAMIISFSDGTSGVFVAAIPEPATLCLLMTAAFLLRRHVLSRP